jgi:aryl-alcohol dehydrogenase-like predicted oxidoreductase
LELGVNWIDTAAVYGLGHSEEVVREALEGIPSNDRPYIFTKCGMVWDERWPDASPRQVLEPASIRRECEASLHRLGVERIDLFQFHWPDQTGTPIEDSWEAMIRCNRLCRSSAGRSQIPRFRGARLTRPAS